MNQELINDLNAVLAKHGWKYRLGDFVRKKTPTNTSSEWDGYICGIYITKQTREGYAIEAGAYKNTVQISPEKALEADGPDAFERQGL